MNVVGSVKSGYAAGARGVGRGLRKIGVLGDEPPLREQRWKHWTYSLFCAHDSLAIAELDVPWWTYGSIDAVERWLTGREAPIRAFEWGSGASTVWLAKRVDSIDSVEHHRGFGEMMQVELESLHDLRAAHVDLQIIEPVESARPAVGSHKEGMGGLDFSAYVARIDEVGGEFDLVVVDGRAREACLRAGLAHLASDGIVVFDNTHRRRYREAIAAEQVSEDVFRGLTPSLPYPDQTSVITRP